MIKNLCIMEKYTNSRGEEQVSWHKIGTIFTSKEGKEYAKLFHIPNTLISVFEQRTKETDQAGEDIF